MLIHLNLQCENSTQVLRIDNHIQMGNLISQQFSKETSIRIIQMIMIFQFYSVLSATKCFWLHIIIQ